MGSKKSIVGGDEEGREKRRYDDLIADMKEERMAGVRGETNPFRRIAILRGEVPRLPILVGWGDFAVSKN